MRRSKNILLLFFFVFSSVILNPLFCQEKPRIAVLPFSPLEVSESEARVITSLFETALVKTGVYNVLEQNQISEILDAQAFSLSGCTDDACAVEVGELLSAELIILGEFSRVGERYIANAKIIDVELGKNEAADSVSAGSIADMTDTQITLLAYKLAGLTYTGGGAEVKIVENFSEVFINTEPDGADIYINGRKRGVSPILIEKVPQGQVQVTASKGNMYGELQKAITGSDLVEIYIKLDVTYGRMFIKSSVAEVDVLIDGENKGRLRKDLYKDIPAGTHTLTLNGEGWFWEDQILIEKEKTLTVEAYPREMAVFRYSLPAGAEGRIESKTISEKLSDSGKLDLPAGSYTVVVTLPDHDPVEQEITMMRADVIEFTPDMKFSQAFLDEKARDEYQAELQELQAWAEQNPESFKGQFDRFYNFYTELLESGYSFAIIEHAALEGAEAAVSGMIDELIIWKDANPDDFRGQFKRFYKLYLWIAEYGDLFSSLQDTVKIEALNAGRARIDELDAKTGAAGKGWSKTKKIVFWSSVSAFLAGQAAGHLVYWLLAEPEREFYEDTVDGANTPALAEESHKKLAFYRGLAFTGWGISAAGFTGAVVTPFIGGGTFSGLWEREKADISGKMAEMNGGIQ